MITVKIHDVLHDKSDDSPSTEELEEIMESHSSSTVSNVRIAPGPKNSPIFVTFDSNNISIFKIMFNCQSIVRAFSWYFKDVDVENTVRKSNIQIQS